MSLYLIHSWRVSSRGVWGETSPTSSPTSFTTKQPRCWRSEPTCSHRRPSRRGNSTWSKPRWPARPPRQRFLWGNHIYFLLLFFYQVLNHTSRIEIQLLENSLSTNKLEKELLLQTTEIRQLRDKNRWDIWHNLWFFSCFLCLFW